MPRIWPGSSLNVEEKNDELVVSATGDIFERIFLCVALFFTGLALYEWMRYHGAIHEERFKGILGAACVGWIGIISLYERSRFVFDRSRRVLTWSRRKLWGSKAGQVPFDAITRISANSPIGDDRTAPMRRVAVHTATEQIPVTATYTAELYEEQLKLAERISVFVGKPSHDFLMEMVRASAREGRMTEAIRLLRQERKMSLEEAKKIAEEAKKG